MKRLGLSLLLALASQVQDYPRDVAVPLRIENDFIVWRQLSDGGTVVVVKSHVNAKQEAAILKSHCKAAPCVNSEIGTMWVIEPLRH